MMADTAAIEKHYTLKELAELWGFSENTIRKIFQDQPGVLKLGSATGRGRRGYVSLRIPHTLAMRVHHDLSR